MPVELIKSSGGVYEITVNGDLIYSKRRTGAFPTEDEIIDKIKSV